MHKSSLLYLTSIVLLIVALDYSVQRPASAQTAPTFPLLSPSTIFEEISDRARREPSLSATELADFANTLLRQKGLNYDFDVCGIVKNPNQIPDLPSVYKQSYTFTLSRGGKLDLRFPVSAEGLCGGCSALIPSFGVNREEMLFVMNGKHHRIKRPRSFVLEEAWLVDHDMKRVLRTWQLPYETVPLGISPDGTKLYLDFWQVEIDNLALEVSTDGSIAFRDRSKLHQTKGEEVKDHPRDPNNSYLSFIRFQVGDKNYIVKYIAPCT